jgi:hypothetical protein
MRNETMTQEFLLPETSVREAGAGPELRLGEAEAGLLNVTMEITRATERESLEVSIWGSSDGVEWGSQPLARLPRRFYCGTYHSAIDVSDGSTRYLKAQWRVDRWAPGGEKPLFTVAMSVNGIGPDPAAPAPRLERIPVGRPRNVAAAPAWSPESYILSP